MLALLIGRIEPQSAGQRRYQRIVQAIVTAALSKGVTALVLLISVPLTLGYLGAERYGVWIAMTTVIGWLSITDIGVGLGLLNLLADAQGRQHSDLSRRYVATAFWTLMLTAVILGVLVVPVCNWIDWQYVLDLRNPRLADETRLAIEVAVVCCLLALPFTIIPRIYIAYQEGVLANAWLALGSIVGLVGIVAVTHWKGGLVALSAGVLGSYTLVAIGSGVYLFAWHKPALRPSFSSVSVSSLKSIFGIGTLFLLAQLQSLVVSQSDVLIISHFLGPDRVTPYSVTFRLFAYVTMPVQLAAQYFLSAIAEAYAREDLAWIRLAFKRFLFGSFAYALVFTSALAAFFPSVLSLWVGNKALPDQGLVAWMSGWTLVFVLTLPISTVLTATGNLSRMLLFAYVAAVLNVALSVFLVRPFGAPGVVAATTITNATCALLPYTLELARFFRRTERLATAEQG
jgi:O-antigen/teichoic acid export membrane protein